MKQTIQELKTMIRMRLTYGKAQIIARSKPIHKSSVGNIWMVEGSCKHVLACCALEISARERRIPD
jgi:hypothetical protein